MNESYVVKRGESRALAGADLKGVIPWTVYDLLDVANDKRTAWKLFENEKGGSMTVSEFHLLCKDMSKAILTLGIKHGDFVGVLGYPCVEYAAAEIAVMQVGAVVVPLYPEGSAEINEVALQTTNSKLVFCPMSLVHKVMTYRKQLTELKNIIIWAEENEMLPETEGEIHFWDDILFKGSEESDAQFNEARKKVKPENPAMLTPVSGMSQLKMAIFSQDNITYSARKVPEHAGLTSDDHLVSHIPFFLMLGKILDVYGALAVGYHTTFLNKGAWNGTKSQFLTGMQNAKPTFIIAPGFAVEKMQWHVEKTLQFKDDKLKAFMKGSALECGRKSSNATMKQKKVPMNYGMHKGFFQKTREMIGFDNCRYGVSFATPLSEACQKYLWNLNMPVVDGYEKLESCGLLAFGAPGMYKSGTMGKPIEGWTVKIHKPDENGVGEILVKGRSLFLGYLDDEELTSKRFTSDGFFRTNDLGSVDEEGYLIFKSRKSDIIVLATGEQVNPTIIEGNLKSLIPGVHQVLVVGQGQNSLGCLITMKTAKQSATGEARLASCVRYTTQAKTVQELKKDVRFKDLVAVALEQVNRLATSKNTKVTTYHLCMENWTPQNNMAAPGGMLRRDVIMETYKAEIEKMFA
ncbi:Long-chain-fatty-acid--CoA ligase ACSBG2 [Porphyridium purpureum]|uniref:Long-chain-fatty-acid--CoA ligase ACSBG2 n=1 Tax=Porphyridium purpureum TaxID=35688 RepID=A0A5J4Z8Y3_PORPP|nr:Long-chain-fatty-acid--CoA ligase ACSBG2 [Porphyridium purpureum]|eukprot:POR6010..scf295_1